ncbi:MAG: M56 family metallopeptidase, partial [Planctomycetota bacterium]|nr:M56 family metallopeptidase [Planctomycetota bacterium]
MVSGRVSPMIWCGLRPTLVLPTELWSELDDEARRAVAHHELAHLRRRDHWVRWIELAACALYWWHPVVWWARRRLREEADLCCDAWVTLLMPGQRRTYAHALLTTKEFLSRRDVSASQFGLSVTTANARRFSRRLTMVMTHRMRPNVSVTGLTLAALVAVSGSIASPLLACPTEKSKEKHRDSDKSVVVAPRAPKAPKAPKAP